MAKRKKSISPMAYAGILSFQELSNGIKVQPKKFILFVLIVILIELILNILF